MSNPPARQIAASKDSPHSALQWLAENAVDDELHFDLSGATAAQLLLDSCVDVMEVKEMLAHGYVTTTTQIYDKRRRAAREGRASHKCRSARRSQNKRAKG